MAAALRKFEVTTRRGQPVRGSFRGRMFEVDDELKCAIGHFQRAAVPRCVAGCATTNQVGSTLARLSQVSKAGRQDAHLGAPWRS